MATFGPLQCETYPPSNLTGPCLIETCATDSINGGGCGGEVALCTAGSVNYVEYFAQSKPINCEYLCTADCVVCPDGTEIESDTCGIYELAGQIGGAGDTWSLYDATSTVMLSLYSGSRADGTPFTIFTVDMEDAASTQPYVYFQERATVENANVPVSTSSSPTRPMMLTSSTSATEIVTISSSAARTVTASMSAAGTVATSISAAATATSNVGGVSTLSQATMTTGTAATMSSSGSASAAGSDAGNGRKVSSERAMWNTLVAIIALFISHVCSL